MKFDFIPFSLNADIGHFKGQIQYISSDNGVELYKARKVLKNYILGIPVSNINLYFYEGNLITLYIHLVENPPSLEQVRKTFETSIGRQGEALKTGISNGYSWNGQNEILALINSQENRKVCLYYTLLRFSIL